jgi:tellurite resistance protein
MITEDRINLLARLARNPEDAEAAQSILTLAAASYGSRPMDESTVPTGFDPHAAALFESIVESAFLVATADGVFDDDERKTFERIVTIACSGALPQNDVSALVEDLGDQLDEDGLDVRIARVSVGLGRIEHAREALRIAALIAQTTDDVSEVERSVLDKLAIACKLDSTEVESALSDAKAAVSSSPEPS